MSITGTTLNVNKLFLTRPFDNGYPNPSGEFLGTDLNKLDYGQIAYSNVGGRTSEKGKIALGTGNTASEDKYVQFSSDKMIGFNGDSDFFRFRMGQSQTATSDSYLFIDAGTHDNNFNVEHNNKLYVTTNRAYNSSLTDYGKRFARICIDRSELENTNNYAIFGVGVVKGNNDFDYKGAIFANGNAVFQDLSYTNIAQTSDKSKKKSIYNLNDPYDKLFDELKPKRYKWKEKSWGENQMLGFIANDIKESLDKNEITDQSIILGEEGDFSFSSTQIIPLNTWQIQKLKKRVSDLEERLAKLENKD